MAIPSGLSKITTNTGPKKLTKITDQILNILFKINKLVLELNSIDFCNPLGYILTKALPPGGLAERGLLELGKVVNNFIGKAEGLLSPDRREGETEEEYQIRIYSLQSQIEELRLSLEDLIPSPEIIDIIPGGEGLVKTINNINLALVVGEDIAGMKADPSTIKTKISLIQSFVRKLAPFTTPINIATLLIGDKADDLNKMLRDFIKPGRFKDDLGKIIKQVKALDNAILLIQQEVKFINTILKTINVLIKLYKFVIKIIKMDPTPLAVGGGGSPVISKTSGMTSTSADRVSNNQRMVDDLEKTIKMVSTFLDVDVLVEINKIRHAILRLLVGLNLLYKNLNDCPYIEDQSLKAIQAGIDSLNKNLQTLDELFPNAKDIEDSLPKQYMGYKIDIIKEEVVDEGIKLIRRRVVVADQTGIIQYEGKATYSNKDYILISEGQYYVDKLTQSSTSDKGNDSPSDQSIMKLADEIGLDYTNTMGGALTPD